MFTEAFPYDAYPVSEAESFFSLNTALSSRPPKYQAPPAYSHDAADTAPTTVSGTNTLQERHDDEEEDKHLDNHEPTNIGYALSYNVSMGSITSRSPTFADSLVREASYGEVFRFPNTINEGRAPRSSENSLVSRHEHAWSDSTVVRPHSTTTLGTLSDEL